MIVDVGKWKVANKFSTNKTKSSQTKQVLK